MTIDLIQGTREWHQARLGKLTASRIADMMAKTKTGYGASRKNYTAELVIQRLTGTVPETYTNAAMQWGTDHEPQARDLYAMINDVEVREVGLALHPRLSEAAASPDGLVSEDGLVEIKCPNSATHIETLLTEKVPQKYQLQMQFQMACTERQWCDYISYDPRMPTGMVMWTKRVERDDRLISDIENEAIKFLREVDEQVEALRKKFGVQEA
jgi:putative phage-type endonuclease